MKLPRPDTSFTQSESQDQAVCKKEKHGIKKYFFGFFFGGLIFFYITTYLTLSLCGRYEPSVLGAAGVKSYAWAPKGFYTNHYWKISWMMTFFPLYFADTKLWHDDDDWDKGKFPVDFLN
jgi:hypothetical protein